MTATGTRNRRSVRRLRNDDKQQLFSLKSKAKSVANANELLPGLNDISDAFEALPMEIVKYVTLFKEVDAKYIGMVPLLNREVKNYVERLHLPLSENVKEDEWTGGMKKATKIKKLTNIKDKLHEMIPCLEEKMHVSLMASELIHRHLYRINSDFDLILHHNEIPESIRIGPLNHPAVISDSNGVNDVNTSLQAQRSESRREALAAKKAAHKDYPVEDPEEKKKNKGNSSVKEHITQDDLDFAGSANLKSIMNTKKRNRKDSEEYSRPPTPVNTTNQSSANLNKKRQNNKPKREERDNNKEGVIRGPNTGGGDEPTYCYCNQVSFGEMVGCDGDDCKREWFHLPCIGFKHPPKGKWYCDECLIKQKKLKKF